jgi:hypothetical protein
MKELHFVMSNSTINLVDFRVNKPSELVHNFSELSSTEKGLKHFGNDSRD